MGSIIAMGKECPQCGSPKVKIITRGRKPWELCLDPDCPTKEEYKARQKEKTGAGGFLSRLPASRPAKSHD